MHGVKGNTTTLKQSYLIWLTCSATPYLCTILKKENAMTKTKPQLTLVKPGPLLLPQDTGYLMVGQKEFQEAFGIPISPSTQALYIKLVEEEHEEWVEQYYSLNGNDYDELKELTDLLYVTAGLAYQMKYDMQKTPVYAGDGYYDTSITNLVSEIALGNKSKHTLGSLMYCIFGYADAMNWPIREAYKRVHISNLSKLGDDGKPLRREDGKVLKGPDYKLADLADLTEGK